ncbi:coagulation factor IX-like [Monomorium pharaonis]|uniref:coagulation factor IX-like n=1 Tax=Monomorium pharaonis TaxID=307658 RepID=UPI00174702D7|nr:coagulation factor IX-like [Monomorium pharaonis]
MFFKAIVFFAVLAVAVTVHGDEDAPVGAYPFIVSLQSYSQHFCTGSIFNERWATAGHCVQANPSLDNLRVKAGKYNIYINEDSKQTVKVTQAFVHENFQE